MSFVYVMFFFFKQKTAYEMRISDWSSDVCSSDLYLAGVLYLGVIASAVTFPLYFGVIRAVGPGQAAWSSVLIPIIAMGFSTVFEAYRWAPLSIIGGAVTLVGLVIAVAKRPERPSLSGNKIGRAHV